MGRTIELPSLFAALLGGTMALTSNAEARSFRVDDIPNGGQRECLNCHETEGGIVFTPFGSDVRSHLTGPGQTSQRRVGWGPELAALDSDGDGFTNGEELGDPNGTWRPGDPSPGGTPSNPGDPASKPVTGTCGDGVLAPAETCDGDQLRGATCESLNLGSGTVVCNAMCRLDTSGCNVDAPSDGDDGDDGGAGDTPAADAGGCAVSAVTPTGGAPVAAPLLAILAVLLARRSRAR